MSVVSQQAVEVAWHYLGGLASNVFIEPRTGSFEVEFYRSGASNLCGLVEAGGWIDVPGRAYRHEEITTLQCLVDLVHMKGHFTKPNDMWP